jgi:tRNA U34 5-methylaminomethyl-2-thiouridine-forming methyltransferase MnmC
LTNFKNRQIVQSADGSHTIFLPELNEHFHSVNGAIQESMHVFIEQGLLRVPAHTNELNILEVGFGTGLNCLLSILFSHDRAMKVRYCGLEAFPLAREEYVFLNHPEQVASHVSLVHPLLRDLFLRLHFKDIPGRSPKPDLEYGMRDLFLRLHEGPWNTPFEAARDFVLEKRMELIERAILPEGYFDLVYFDAFAPHVQPGVWNDQVFARIHAAMKAGGQLVTYSAKGSLKRTLKTCGFQLEHPGGPPGKREMTRACKI